MSENTTNKKELALKGAKIKEYSTSDEPNRGLIFSEVIKPQTVGAMQYHLDQWHMDDTYVFEYESKRNPTSPEAENAKQAMFKTFFEKKILQLLVDRVVLKGYTGKRADVPASSAQAELQTLLTEWKDRLTTDPGAQTTEYNYYINPVSQGAIENGTASFYRDMPVSISELYNGGQLLNTHLGICAETSHV